MPLFSTKTRNLIIEITYDTNILGEVPRMFKCVISDPEEPKKILSIKNVMPNWDAIMKLNVLIFTAGLNVLQLKIFKLLVH